MAQQYRYRIPPELSPGVYRAGVGFFQPGQVITLPDGASTKDEVPNSQLIPLDEASREYLVQAQKRATEARRRAVAEAAERKKEVAIQEPVIKPVEAAAPKGEPADEQLTVKQVAKRHGRP